MFSILHIWKKFTIVTDHLPLISFKTSDINISVQKWRFKLSEYDYDIIYKYARLNANADALPRNPVDFLQINVITRRQASIDKSLKEKEKEEINRKDLEPNSVEPPTMEISRQIRRKRFNKKINYAESDNESEVKAEIKLPETNSASKTTRLLSQTMARCEVE